MARKVKLASKEPCDSKVEEPPDLTAEDEEILDSIWAQIGQKSKQGDAVKPPNEPSNIAPGRMDRFVWKEGDLTIIPPPKQAQLNPNSKKVKMSRIHYFQRFSQRENVDTNNTLLLLSRIQSTDPRLLRAILVELFSDLDVEQSGFEVGVQFSQQTTAPSSSVPDGMLFQSSFRIVVETKRSPKFRIEQLETHLSAFGNESTKVLLLLSPERVDIRIPKAVEEGILVVSRSFFDIISACRATCTLHNLALAELIDDYEEYCLGSNLISNEADRMMAVAVGNTLEENKALRLYYAPQDRGYQKHKYIGLYSNKAICAVGEVENIVCANLTNDVLSIVENKEFVTDEQKERIIQAIHLIPSHNYLPLLKRRFFLVKKFVETDFQKISSGGLQGKRYFSLRDELNLKTDASLPDIETIADSLQKRTWK